MKVLDYNGLKTLGTWLKSLKKKVDQIISELSILSYPFKNPDTISSLAIYGVDNAEKSIVMPIPNDNCLYWIEGIDYPGGGILNIGLTAFFGKSKGSQKISESIGMTTSSNGQNLLIIPIGGKVPRIYIKLLPVGDLVAQPYTTDAIMQYGTDGDLETMCKKYGNGQYKEWQFVLDTEV